MMRNQQAQKSTTPIIARTLSFSHDGRGIARIDGKTTFITGALANETVSFNYTRKKRDFDEGRLEAVIAAATDRVEPDCPHYVVCGGCALQHLNAESQVLVKQKILLDMLTRIGHVTTRRILVPLTFESWHYRSKARLSVRYVEKKQAVLVGFREKHNPRYIADINRCLILHKAVDANLMSLRELIATLDGARDIAQIELAAGDDEVALIFRHLKPLTIADEKKLLNFAQTTQLRIFLQSGGPETVKLLHESLGSEELCYSLRAEGLRFKFHPNDFTQINLPLNQLMVQQALQLLALTPDDKVLDLFCGLGNFSYQ